METITDMVYAIFIPDTDCIKTCHHSWFSVSQKDPRLRQKNNPFLQIKDHFDPTGSKSSKTKTWFYFDDSEQDHYEEYLLYDFGGIIGSVGGMLGLFLGFSCLGLLDHTTAWMGERFGQN